VEALRTTRKNFQIPLASRWQINDKGRRKAKEAVAGKRHQMKTARKHWAKLAAAGGLSMALIALFVQGVARGDAPALSIALTGTNEVTLTVTNGVPTGVYEIWWTEFLDAEALSLTNGAWEPLATGTTGQTNFVFDLGDTDTGFFRALNGNDFDLDGFPNYADARPFDPSVGILTVTIESPANGANVQ
jgi:hypothetical protein